MTAAEHIRDKIETLRPMFQHSGVVLNLLDALEAMTPPRPRPGEINTSACLEEAATILGWERDS